LDQKSLEALGTWLRRRWHSCQDRKNAADAKLEELGIPEVQLRSEWAAQLKEQTKPAPRMFCSMRVCTKTYMLMDYRQVEEQGKASCSSYTPFGKCFGATQESCHQTGGNVSRG
jgi:hypothetical protein